VIVRRVVEARRSHGGGRENTPQYPTYGAKGHIPNVSGASSSAYQMPSSMQPSQQSTSPNALPMREKSDFDDDGGSVPWWKKMFCCR